MQLVVFPLSGALKKHWYSGLPSLFDIISCNPQFTKLAVIFNLVLGKRTKQNCVFLSGQSQLGQREGRPLTYVSVHTHKLVVPEAFLLFYIPKCFLVEKVSLDLGINLDYSESKDCKKEAKQKSENKLTIQISF